MKKVLLTAVLVLAMAGMAFAADNATVSVSASVLGTCKFTTTSANLAFGSLDPAVGGNASASATLSFWCTKGATVTVSDNKSGTYNLSNGTENIPYSVTYTPASTTGAGKSSPINLTVAGTIQEADWVNASAGTYTDTITVSINP